MVDFNRMMKETLSYKWKTGLYNILQEIEQYEEKDNGLGESEDLMLSDIYGAVHDCIVKVDKFLKMK